MAGISTEMLERQVRNVRRRIMIQAGVNGLIVGWTGACATAAIWLLAKPFVLGASGKPSHDWAFAGSAFLVATIAAVAWAIRRAPAPVDAALSLDERFQLRERVTTSLTLSPSQQASSAGQALLFDAQTKIESLDIGSRFPIELGWKSALVPAAVTGLVLLAVFYHPAVNTAQGKDVPSVALTPEVAKAIEQKKLEYLQRPKTDPKQEKRVKNPELEKIEAKLQEILKKPMATTDDIKDRLSEISTLEEQLKKKEKEEAEKVEAFKEQMKQIDQLAKKDKTKPEDKGPAKDLRDALDKGDTKKAKEEADRLSKKVKNNELDKKEKDHLEQEMKDLKDDLEKLKREREKQMEEKRKENEERRQEREKQIEQKQKEGKLDKEQADQEKQKVDEERKQEQKDQKEQKEQMDRMSKKLGKCEQCMKNGDKDGAAEALREAAEELEKQEQQEQDLEDIQNELQRMQELREGMAKECEKCQNGRDGQDGDAETLSRRNGENGDGKPNSGRGKGGVGKGRRPESKTGDSASVDGKQKAQFDKKGAKIHVGTAGQAEKVIGKTSVTIEGEIKQASQDAPDAVDTQRIPPGYKESTKGYFKNIGGQKTGETAPKK